LLGGKFRHSKFFAALMADSITRSEFMREKRTPKAGVPLSATAHSSTRSTSTPYPSGNPMLRGISVSTSGQR
jgi:hypothetical protein